MGGRFANPLVLAVVMATAATADPVDPLAAAYTGMTMRGNTVVFADGFRLDAGTMDPAMPFETVLRRASVRDMFRQDYPARQPPSAPPLNFDPGRFRSKAFFDHLYGDCRKGEVEPRFEEVTWLPASWGGRVMVTRVNGVASRLREVSAEIEKLPPQIRRAAYPSAGTYVCRSVADTGQPSMHAYGAAIDLNLDVSDYWMWQNGGRSPVWRNRMPRDIVDIFERHGFIWGGRWYHYDTMHFEYRPELLPLSRAPLPH